MGAHNFDKAAYDNALSQRNENYVDQEIKRLEAHADATSDHILTHRIQSLKKRKSEFRSPNQTSKKIRELTVFRTPEARKRAANGSIRSIRPVLANLNKAIQSGENINPKKIKEYQTLVSIATKTVPSNHKHYNTLQKAYKALQKYIQTNNININTAPNSKKLHAQNSMKTLATKLKSFGKPIYKIDTVKSYKDAVKLYHLAKTHSLPVDLGKGKVDMNIFQNNLVWAASQNGKLVIPQHILQDFHNKLMDPHFKDSQKEGKFDTLMEYYLCKKNMTKGCDVAELYLEQYPRGKYVSKAQKFLDANPQKAKAFAATRLQMVKMNLQGQAKEEAKNELREAAKGNFNDILTKFLVLKNNNYPIPGNLVSFKAIEKAIIDAETYSFPLNKPQKAILLNSLVWSVVTDTIPNNDVKNDVMKHAATLHSLVINSNHTGQLDTLIKFYTKFGTTEIHRKRSQESAAAFIQAHGPHNDSSNLHDDFHYAELVINDYEKAKSLINQKFHAH